MSNVQETVTIEDVVNEAVTFKADALRAARDLARTKPWQGSFTKRLADLKKCLAALADAYGLQAITLKHDGNRAGTSATSDLARDGRKITMRGRLSVVTLFHLFAKCRAIQSGAGLDGQHFPAITWSVNLFKRKFPISFARCRLVGGLLVNDARRDD